MNRKFFLITLIAVFMPCAAFATQASLYLGGGFSGSQIDLSGIGGGKDDIAEPGGAIGAQLLFDATKAVALGVDVNYTGFGEKDSSELLAPAFNSTLNLKSTVILAVAKWSALPDQRVRPYLLGGLGVHSSSFKYEISPAAGFAWSNTHTTEKRTIIDDTQSAAAVAFGVGLDVDVAPRVFLGAEARFVGLGKVTWDTNALGQSLGIANINGSLGIVNLMGKIGFKF